MDMRSKVILCLSAFVILLGLCFYQKATAREDVFQIGIEAGEPLWAEMIVREPGDISSTLSVPSLLDYELTWRGYRSKHSKELIYKRKLAVYPQLFPVVPRWSMTEREAKRLLAFTFAV